MRLEEIIEGTTYAAADLDLDLHKRRPCPSRWTLVDCDQNGKISFVTLTACHSTEIAQLMNPILFSLCALINA